MDEVFVGLAVLARSGHWYYFGCGVIGRIEAAENGKSYYAQILKGHRFRRALSIYHADGSYFETSGYSDVRDSPNPPWRVFIQPISVEAFRAILTDANADIFIQGPSST